MKTNLLTFVAWATLTATLTAQPTLQNNVLPAFGDVVFNTEADTNGIEPGAAGANQTWDFTALTPLPGETTVQSTFAPAAGTPFADQFPEANAAAIIPTADGTAYGYFKLENNRISFYGSAIAGLDFHFDDPEINVVTPITFHEGFSDLYSSTLSIPDNGEFFTKAGKAVEYDAYGTLKMPGATYNNAMRLKTVTVSLDSVVFEGGYQVSNLTTTTYEWYVANRPGPQVSVSYSGGTSTTVITGIPPFDDVIPVSKSVNYISNLTTGTGETPEQALGLRVESLSPNPATETLTLRYTADAPAGELRLLVLNAAGQLVQAQILPVVAGDQAVTLPVTQLPAGQYFLSLTDGQAVKTLSWQKQ